MPESSFRIDLFQSHITTVSQFLNQPQCNRLAKILTWIRTRCMNKAWSDGSVPGPEQTLDESINQRKLALPTLRHCIYVYIYIYTLCIFKCSPAP